MEELNYFTGRFSKFELVNHFGSLDENKLKYELENFTNQYLKLSEEEQLKYVEYVHIVFSISRHKIDKTIKKEILETLNKILSKNPQAYRGDEIFYYLSILYNYLFLTKEYEEYSIFFEKESCFFKILDLVLKDNLEKSKISYDDLLSVFVILFEQNSLPEEKRIYFESKLEQFISFIFENNDFEITIYWYFELDKLNCSIG